MKVSDFCLSDCITIMAVHVNVCWFQSINRYTVFSINKFYKVYFGCSGKRYVWTSVLVRQRVLVNILSDEHINTSLKFDCLHGARSLKYVLAWN